MLAVGSGGQNPTIKKFLDPALPRYMPEICFHLHYPVSVFLKASLIIEKRKNEL